MYLEVSARLPKDEASLNQSEKTVRASRAAGVSVIGTVILVGHRYEMSQSLESWKEFTRTSWKSLTVAEPILAKQEMRLAIENHTDWRFDQMLRILEHVDSDAVGVKIDAGNNMSLLEGSL